MSRHWKHLPALALLVLLPAASYAQLPAPAVPAYQFSWGTAGSAPGQFNQPGGVAIDAIGRVYVADKINNRVQKFDATGNLLPSSPPLHAWGPGSDTLATPAGVAAGLDNSVYVADGGGFLSVHNRIVKFDGSGNFLLKWGIPGGAPGRFINPTAVAVDDSDNVYVVDLPDTMYQVQKFTSTGVFLTRWRYGKVPDGTSIPNAITVDANFNVFALDVGNKVVWEFNSVGVLIRFFGGAGSGNGLFSLPHGIAADAFGNVYIADWGNWNVQIFDPMGNYRAQWTNFTPNPPGGLPPASPGNVGFYQPEGIAVSPQGDVYVSEWGSRRVDLFGGAGLALVSGVGVEVYTWGAGFVQQPFGVASSPGGDIFVADTGNNRIDNFFPNGTLFTSWGTAGTGNGQFNGPTGLALTNAANLYVTDTGNSRVQEFTLGGAYVTQWGTPGSGNGQFNVPFGVAVDGNNRVDVVDQGNNRVEQFDGSGTFLTAWGVAGSGNGQFNAPYGIAIDGNHDVYVADANNSRIQKFNITGGYLTQWGGLGSASGQFNGPHAVTVDAAGNVYVGDQGNNRIQKFTSAGAYLAQWPASGLPLPPPPAQGPSSVASAGVDGLAVDAYGNIYFADGVNNAMVKYVNPPAITLIADVPGDAGLRVRLHVHRSSVDVAGATPQVTSYEIFRRIDPPGTAWELVGGFPATGASDYVADASTLANAAPGAVVFAVFKVRAHTSNDQVYFDSAPGYGYSIDNGGGPVSVPAPRDEGLALAGARPNPTLGGPLNVEFTLAKSAPAALELFDLAGRRVAAQDVGPLGVGRHVVELAPAHRLATGIYLVRLRQGASSRVVRATVLN